MKRNGRTDPYRFVSPTSLHSISGIVTWYSCGGSFPAHLSTVVLHFQRWEFIARMSAHSVWWPYCISHFPTPACSPVKQSTDTEAKTLKITSEGGLNEHLAPYMARCSANLSHTQAPMKEDGAYCCLLCPYPQILHLYFFSRSVRWHPPFFKCVRSLFCPQVMATFPSSRSLFPLHTASARCLLSLALTPLLLWPT